jgi:cation diffusion facilitator CzcD-associated flavoprotein CzcO
MTDFTSLPIVVIGAGPVGLAAAARLLERGMMPMVLERGPKVGAAVRAWAHVRLFSPWRYNIDDAAHGLLAATGWQAPNPDELPTGAELAAQYLDPLASQTAIKDHLRLNVTVTAITRLGLDKVTSAGREKAPFVVEWQGEAGNGRVLARAVIDASGTWGQPNPIGVDGIPVPGEMDAGDRIVYGIPEVLGRDRAAFANRRVLVVGGGHSAIHAALDLVSLQEQAPETQLFWALRRNRIDKLLGGGLNDQLPERGALGIAAKAAMDTNKLAMLAPFSVDSIERSAGGILLTANWTESARASKSIASS